MPSLNKVLLIGHLGRDPELRQTQTGKPVCNFTLATNEKRGGEEHTEWHRIVAWEKTAGYCAHYLTKGALVYVEGRIQSRTWQDKSGEVRNTTEIVANRVLGLKYEDRADGAQAGAPAAHGGQNGFTPDPGLDPDDMATNPPKSGGQSFSDPPPSGDPDLPF